MQFRDLRAQYAVLKEEMDSAIAAVLNDCSFISGKQVAALETALAQYVGVKHCITCGNGTDALSMVLMAWDLHEGDAVFVPDFTFFASAEVIAFQGATPVFYDVCKDSFNADPRSLENAILSVLAEGKLTPRAIIAVDLFGLPAPYPQLEHLAKKYDLLLLEDAAQGFGGSIDGKRAGSFGDAATTSFFPAKPLGCYGDGGAIFTDDDVLAEYLRSIRVHGKGSDKYDNIRIGVNSRLDTLQAAVLQVKLRAFIDYEAEAVDNAAKRYDAMLGDTVKTPVVTENMGSSWAQYTIQLKDAQQRNELQAYLKQQGIPSMVYYPKPMHLQTAFADVQSYVECPVSEQLCQTVLSLPMHPYLTQDEQQTVTAAVKEFLSK